MFIMPLFSWNNFLMLILEFYLLRYEGRCGLPTNFDANYCYALGYGAGALLHSGKTGLISSVCFYSFFPFSQFNFPYIFYLPFYIQSCPLLLLWMNIEV